LLKVALLKSILIFNFSVPVAAGLPVHEGPMPHFGGTWEGRGRSTTEGFNALMWFESGLASVVAGWLMWGLGRALRWGWGKGKYLC